jgi:hypothetical protein
MSFEYLWPSLIYTEILPIDVEQFKIEINNSKYSFDNHSINWRLPYSKAVKSSIDDLANQWMEEAKIENADIEMTSSYKLTTPPLQGTALHNNHNCELVALLVVQTGLENGIKHSSPLFPMEQHPINTPLGAPTGQNSLVLNDPRGTAVTLQENGYKLFKEIPLENNQLILFPSYIPYYLLPNVGYDDRILIVCNYEVE